MFGVPTQALFGQLLIGLINGAFYAMLSLGLSVIFGLLNIINFTHGAQYMMGAFGAYFVLQWAGLGYWWALLIAPIAVGVTGIVLERTTLKRLYQLDHVSSDVRRAVCKRWLEPGSRSRPAIKVRAEPRQNRSLGGTFLAFLGR